MVGLVLVLRKPRTKAMVLWGLAYVAFGVSRMYGSVYTLVKGTFAVTTPAHQIVFVGASLVLAAAAALLLRHIARQLPVRRDRLFWSIGTAWFVLAVASFFAYPPFRTVFDRSALFIMGFFNAASSWIAGLALALLWIALIEGVRGGAPKESRTWLLALFPLAGVFLGAGNLVFGQFIDEVTVLDAAGPSFLTLAFSLVFFLPIVWCFRLLGGPHGRFAATLQAGLVVWLVIMMLNSAALTGVRAAGRETLAFEVFGVLVGVARIVALSTVLYAIFYGDFLVRPLKPPAVRRGTIAAFALAALFVTAQILQNVLGAKLGLVWGGAMAGVVVLGAFPLQRMAEQRLGGGGAKGEDAFRSAARLAMRDRFLTSAEEKELVVLAHRLGVAPDRAYAILAAEGGADGGTVGA